ncbi:MAG: thioredoxin domain-containing protein [Myxococcota bacterium]
MKLSTLVALCGALAAAGCGTSQTQPVAGAGLNSDGQLPEHKPAMELFVMSQCPYGVQVENTMAEVKSQLGDALDVTVHFIGDGEADSLTSMHGPNEVQGDIAQSCAAKQAPEKLVSFIECQNKDPKAVHENWASCAETVELDAGALKTCIEGDEGKQLVAASFAEAKKRGARSSPTMYLDGEKYMGGRKARDFMRAICKTYGDDAPKACSDIPEPPKVDAVFLTDSRCEQCDLKPLEPRLKGELAGLNPTYLDYATDEGKALYEKLKAEDASLRLPAVLLSKDVENDKDGYEAIKRFTNPLGEYIQLKVGGKWDPTAEICDNGTDDDGDGQVDCADDGCSGAMLCRDKIPNKLDLFVMSHCPYGAKAMIAANEVMAAFGDTVDLDVHFIGNERDGELSSMHGPTEVDDDIREVCAEEHYKAGNQYLKFLACHSKDYKSGDWKACATEAGIDPAVIDRCFAAEGKDLLRKSFASAGELSISASPTFLVNNTRTFNAVTAPDLQKQLCQDNPDLAACANVMEASAATAAPVPAGECK